jgi:hypothetical protein
LRVGDRVLSVDHGRVVDVPILEINRTPARHHHVVRVELSNGAVLEISAPHPTADGRTFGDLRTDDVLGGVRIERVNVVPYEPAFTYDILPASDSGTYYAGGVLIGSTLGGAALSSGGTDYAAMSLPVVTEAGSSEAPVYAGHSSADAAMTLVAPGGGATRTPGWCPRAR